MLKIRSSKLTDKGKKRSINQDFVDSFEPSSQVDREKSGYLYILADGVGGHEDGEKASEHASSRLKAEYFKLKDLEPPARLKKLIRDVGNEIFQFSQETSPGKKMATTVVAAVIKGDQLTVGNVGDSRAYLIRDGKIAQLTRDHSLVGELLWQKEISEEEAISGNIKNSLTRSIGGEQDVEVDIFEHKLRDGDRVFLCSDGLTRYTRNRDILALAGSGKPDKTVRRSVDYAISRGGADNISAILIQVGEEVPALFDEKKHSTEPTIMPKTRLKIGRGLFANGRVRIIGLAFLFIFGILAGKAAVTSRPQIEASTEEVAASPESTEQNSSASDLQDAENATQIVPEINNEPPEPEVVIESDPNQENENQTNTPEAVLSTPEDGNSTEHQVGCIHPVGKTILLWNIYVDIYDQTLTPPFEVYASESCNGEPKKCTDGYYIGVEDAIHENEWIVVKGISTSSDCIDGGGQWAELETVKDN